MSKLTKRQNEILTLIQSHIDETGSPPTRAEIAKIMGFKSPNAAEDHLRALARKGAIELVPGTSRGIRLGKINGGIPVLGKLDLEQPTLSEVNILSTLKIDRQLFGPVVHFMVQVPIDNKSLQELGVLKGDYVAVHQTDKAELGQIVALRKNHEIQLRVFTHELQNQSFEGIVVGVVRSLSKTTLN